MYISKKKRKGTYRYLKEKKNIPKGFSRYPPLLLFAVRFFTMAMRRLSMAVG